VLLFLHSLWAFCQPLPTLPTGQTGRTVLRSPKAAGSQGGAVMVKSTVAPAVPAVPKTNYTVLPAFKLPAGYETNLWSCEVSVDLTNWVPLLKNCSGKQSTGSVDYALSPGQQRAFFRMRQQKGWE
jgi:hypothetical protein